MTEHYAVAQGALQGERLNRVVRNTYLLLSLVLGVATVGAGAGLLMNIGWSIGMWVLFMVAFIGGPFAIQRARDGQAAIWMTFAWAGVVGFLLSPLVGAYLRLPGGPGIVFNALATTTVLFAALSAYAVTSRKDFSFMGGFLFAGLIVVLLAIVANIFLAMPLLSLVISAVAVMLMCGLILYDTSRLIHDGNANPVFIVVSLFASITVLFTHLLNLFALLGGDD
ncbi:Bax inhibitor-1 family protein [Rehaibacterium terrae]|jgi:modulator of FtsH protease|uniref:Modulator of FtsH protease n=1 Tax=Rehaibacterium terrae TaxID=1341696 RepID=A0A7W7Y1H4_9GAMM|nr:Bax inhibitor-1 family protein [Rehaibacterium terrae]MBB5016373.1 modulator of FtsH protease [Rehaibacterium terrae]